MNFVKSLKNHILEYSLQKIAKNQLSDDDIKELDSMGIDEYARHYITLIDGDLELFRIEVSDASFLTNSLYLPQSDCSYGEGYDNAFKYWHPNLKNDNPRYREYLVQGKVKIKEKVAEFEKSKLIG